jgi:hypothetical protein
MTPGRFVSRGGGATPRYLARSARHPLADGLGGPHLAPRVEGRYRSAQPMTPGRR